MQELVTELQMQSVFTDVGKLSLQDPAHSAVIPMPAGGTTAPCASTAWLNRQGEAHYALTSPAGGILVVTLPPCDSQGKVWTPGGGPSRLLSFTFGHVALTAPSES